MDNDDESVFHQPARRLSEGQRAAAELAAMDAAGHLDNARRSHFDDAVAGVPITVGSFVRARRRDLELTQVQLADLSGVSEGSIRNIEDDAVDNPRARTWEPIQAILGWAPGSLNRIRAGKKPVEILPVGLMAMFFKLIMNELIEEDARAYLARGFRHSLASADEAGRVPNASVQRLVRILDKALRAAFGITDETHSFRKTTVDQLIAAVKLQPNDSRSQELRETRAKESSSTWFVDQPGRRLAHLPKELEDRLTSALVIDYGMLPCDRDDTTAIMTILIKDDPDRPFTQDDISRIQMFQRLKAGWKHEDESKDDGAEDAQEAEISDEEAADYWAQEEIDRRRGK